MRSVLRCRSLALIVAVVLYCSFDDVFALTVWRMAGRFSSSKSTTNQAPASYCVLRHCFPLSFIPCKTHFILCSHCQDAWVWRCFHSQDAWLRNVVLQWRAMTMDGSSVHMVIICAYGYGCVPMDMPMDMAYGSYGLAFNATFSCEAVFRGCC